MKLKKSFLIGIGLALLMLGACSSPSTESPLATPTSPGLAGSSPLPVPQGLTSGRVVFNSDRTGIYQIYVYDIGADTVTQLTSLSARSVEPAWSPDGQRIVFSTANGDGNHPELTVMNADGSDIVELTSDGTFAVGADWSPDGQLIAFHSNRTDNFEVYVINPDGTGLTNLSNHTADDFMPAWSPDGGELVFVSTRAGSFNLFRMTADGSGVQQLTDDASSDSYYPSWSPDGTQIVFTQKIPGETEVIYVMSADGSDLRSLTSFNYNSSTPIWINDNLIMFSSNREGYWQLYTMTPDGSNQTSLSSNTSGQNPDWIP